MLYVFYHNLKNLIGVLFVSMSVKSSKGKIKDN